MSGLFDDDLADLPPRASRRTKALIGGAVVVVLLFFVVTTFAELYTDRLWYGSVHYGSVFTRLFWTKTLLFLITALVMAAGVGLAMMLAFRARPFYHPDDEHSSIARYRDAINPIRVWLMVGVCTVAGVFAGISGARQWRTFLLWHHGVPFGQTDPYFGKDIGFYVFSLPWWHYVLDFALAVLIVALLSSVVVHYLYGGIRLAAVRERFSAAAQSQISVLVGLLLFVKAIDYWLDRYDLVHDNAPLFTGMSYTDDHAVLPGKNILAGIALICAILFFVNAWRRSWLMPGVGIGLLLICAILLGLIWPAIVQGFQVRPSQVEKESAYIQDNINATRTAYGIGADRVHTETYNPDASGKPTAKQLDQQLSSASILDPGLAQQEFQETQQGRSFYAMSDPLDTDHYVIDGKDRALVLGVRELDQSGLGASDQTWTNLHTVYTHGDGVVAAYANQRNSADTTEATTTQYAQGSAGNTTHTDLEKATGPFENQIYYGEDSPSYSVVGHPAGTPAVELDTTAAGKQTTTTYAGTGGVSIGSTFRRAMYAVKFGSANFLLSSQVNADSKVLYDRDPLQRVAKVAPWLTLDDDVYPVIHDGRLLWVVDGYTTTDDYPGSQRASFSAMTDDAVQPGEGQGLPSDEINYMRNAVKATVDAYDGTVTLYEWDPTDPILKTWESAFPGTVVPRSQIPADLQAHFRYPDEMFKVQRYQLARYHVTDPSDFLQGSQRWQVPVDPNNQAHLEAPYRSFVETPAQNPLDPSGGSGTATTPVWSLSSPLVPYQRQNLAAIMTVNSDASSPDYGTITVLQNADPQADGPQLVSQAFHTNAAISNAIDAFSKSSTLPLYGSVVALPTARNGLVWIEPVYAYPNSGAASSYPVLDGILASYGGHEGYGHTLQAALEAAISGRSSPGTPSPSTSSATAAARADRLLDQAQTLFTKADAATRAHQEARAAAYEAQARAKIASAQKLLAALTSPLSSPTASPVPSAAASPSASPSASASTSAGASPRGSAASATSSPTG